MVLPSRNETRLFFFNTWKKMTSREHLNDLEKKASSIILDHSEYHHILNQPKTYSDYDFPPEGGIINPFLHLSLHLTIMEQIDIDQPQGIRKYFHLLNKKNNDEHATKHTIIEILAEETWKTLHNKTTFDNQHYLSRIENIAKHYK